MMSPERKLYIYKELVGLSNSPDLNQRIEALLELGEERLEAEDYHRRLGRHEYGDVPHFELINIIKSLRERYEEAINLIVGDDFPTAVRLAGCVSSDILPRLELYWRAIPIQLEKGRYENAVSSAKQMYKLTEATHCVHELENINKKYSGGENEVIAKSNKVALDLLVACSRAGNMEAATNLASITLRSDCKVVVTAAWLLREENPLGAAKLEEMVWRAFGKDHLALQTLVLYRAAGSLGDVVRIAREAYQLAPAPGSYKGEKYEKKDLLYQGLAAARTAGDEKDMLWFYDRLCNELSLFRGLLKKGSEQEAFLKEFGPEMILLYQKHDLWKVILLQRNMRLDEQASAGAEKLYATYENTREIGAPLQVAENMFLTTHNPVWASRYLDCIERNFSYFGGESISSQIRGFAAIMEKEGKNDEALSLHLRTVSLLGVHEEYFTAARHAEEAGLEESLVRSFYEKELALAEEKELWYLFDTLLGKLGRGGELASYLQKSYDQLKNTQPGGAAGLAERLERYEEAAELYITYGPLGGMPASLARLRPHLDEDRMKMLCLQGIKRCVDKEEYGSAALLAEAIGLKERAEVYKKAKAGDL